MHLLRYLESQIKMASWPVDVLQTGELTSRDPRDDRAPAVAAGAPLANITNCAISEEENRKRLRSVNPASVTDAEVQESRRRRVALETCEAQMMNGMGNGAILAAITANGAAIAAVAAAAAANGAAIAANGAAIRNIRRRELSRNGTWTHILVETIGGNPVGVAPPSHPVSRGAVLRMTAAQVTALEAAFNLAPGVETTQHGPLVERGR